MGGDAGQEASAAEEERDEQETDCHGAGDLEQVFRQTRPAAVDQVQQMAEAKGNAGYDDGRLHILFCHRPEKKAPEDDFLEESDAKHAGRVADDAHNIQAERKPAPEIPGGQEHQRKIVKKPAGGHGGPAQPVALEQVVFFQKEKQRRGLRDAQERARGIVDAQEPVQRICGGLQRAIRRNAYQRKRQFVFFIELVHVVFSCAAHTAPLYACRRCFFISSPS